MLPPTGLIFIVHAIVVCAQKIGRLFGIRNWNTTRTLGRRTQAFISSMIVTLVATYICWVIVIFVARGIRDQYSNWTLVRQTYQSIFNQQSASISQSIDDGPKVFSIDPLPTPTVQNRRFIYGDTYFPSAVSPYFALYIKNAGILYQTHLFFPKL